MSNLEFLYSSPALGFACGIIAFTLKATILLEETTKSILTYQYLSDSIITAALCTLTGILITSLVSYLKRKWLGMKKKKDPKKA